MELKREKKEKSSSPLFKQKKICLFSFFLLILSSPSNEVFVFHFVRAAVREIKFSLASSATEKIPSKLSYQTNCQKEDSRRCNRKLKICFGCVSLSISLLEYFKQSLFGDETKDRQVEMKLSRFPPKEIVSKFRNEGLKGQTQMCFSFVFENPASPEKEDLEGNVTQFKVKSLGFHFI